MKKTFVVIIGWLWCALAIAQSDSTTFRTYIQNDEYKVYLRINFYDQNITIPGQELYGLLPGYLGKVHNSFCWPIIAVEVKGKKANLQMVNDFGSEDLEATLTQKNDSTYILKQGKGSTIKVPGDGKWVKLPSPLEFKRKVRK